MNGERTRIVWIEERSDYTVDDLVSLSGLPPHVVDELIDCGVLPTISGDRRVFASECVTLVRAARRLRDDFELADQGLALVVSLLRRVRAQESELLGFRAPPPGSST